LDRIYRIEQGWTLSFLHPRTSQPVTLMPAVPGNIAVDLMKTGLLPDLYVGLNPLLAKEWEETEFVYKVLFAIPPLAAGERALLRFGGVDTAAVILVDGHPVAESDNMFVPVEVDASSFAGRKVNIEVRIGTVRSAAERNRARFGTSAADFHHMNRPEALFLRKAQHSFGWDIAPRLLFGGLWKPVTLSIVATPSVARGSIVFTTESVSPDRGRARVRLKGRVSAPVTADLLPMEIRVEGSCGGSRFAAASVLDRQEFEFGITVDKPRLWWPSGYGAPDLYDVILKLSVKGDVKDDVFFRAGIRTVSLENHSDALRPEDNRFCFIVNSERIFCRGSNWVPVDALHRPGREQMLNTLDLFTDSNCNMVRVWGGGVYEDDEFYDYCDKHGLMVWQDFMFGCAYYPQSDAFLAEARREAESVVRRLRNHPSLVLWAGDNETDASFLWHEHGDLLPSANRLSRKLLASVVADLDPSTPYLPSSPFLPDEAVRMKSDTVVAEQHLWGPRGFFKSPYYAKNTALFASEIGYHGCPQKESLRQFLSAPKVWGEYNNDEWLLHATEPGGQPDGPVAKRNELMRSQVRELFGASVDMTDMLKFILASQVTQAEAVKYFIEHFRSRKPAKTGILWWNMKDMWPQFSDSVVDFYFRKKLAYGYVSRSQRPVCLMFREDDDGLTLVAVNDSLAQVKGTWSVDEPETRLKIGNGRLLIPPNSAVSLARFDRPSDMLLWFVEWEDGGDPVVNHYVTGPAPWDFERYRTYLWTILKRTGDRSDTVGYM
jgi:beta-mannosidase